LDKVLLDNVDLKIINLLSNDCRLSYRNIGSSIGMTSKSVKTRVDKLFSDGVIKRFTIRVNPASFGYRKICLMIIRRNAVTEEDIMNHLRLVGHVVMYVENIGGTSMFGLIMKEESDEKIQLLIETLKPAYVQGIFINKAKTSKKDLNQTDLRIISCLLSNPRMELSHIAKQLSLSGKTIARRFDIIKNQHIMGFTLEHNPNVTINYMRFLLIVHTEKGLRNKIRYLIYHELKENIHFDLPIVHPENIIAFILYSQEVFAIDAIISKIERFKGVLTTEFFIPRALTSYEDWLLKEIDHLILAFKSRG
jgi:DNA-binding Lrp family transcriptional regulator